MSAATLTRCAIYTRKSSEEGLDQAFNSLQAQREACEAYIKSQSHEGWRALPIAYDDGGISGGTMQRPGLQRLLADVDAGLVDTIVVYKIDRLTRSLADFARIVERLEAKGASFVSVTQAFNTTTSMGRLTLNVLLSFAQFEREVTGERIRDKIAASKRKGMWMGGLPPLGYDAPVDRLTRALVVNEPEAEAVRSIFSLYLKLGSVSALSAHLAAAGVRPKQRRTKSGEATGGEAFSRGALYHLLQNRLYLGEIPHGKESFPGAHPGIVDSELFDAVQSHLASQRRSRKQRPTRAAQMPLKGLLFDAEGEPMSPSFTHGKRSAVYRYYVSASLQQGPAPRKSDQVLRRISAPAIEERLRAELVGLCGADADASLGELLRPIQRVELYADELRLHFTLSKAPRPLRARLTPLLGDASLGEARLPVSCKVRGGRTWVEAPPGGSALARRDAVLIRGLRQAHRLAVSCGWRASQNKLSDLERTVRGTVYERKLRRLAFLAPSIQRDILAGRQPPGLTLEELLRRELPLSWTEQRQTLGFR